MMHDPPSGLQPALACCRTFCVEIAWSEPATQRCITIDVPEGCTAGEAIRLASLSENHSIDAEEIGIYAKKCSFETILKPGDRVEVYRPLLLSPTEARRLRAATLSTKKSA